MYTYIDVCMLFYGSGPKVTWHRGIPRYGRAPARQCRPPCSACLQVQRNTPRKRRARVNGVHASFSRRGLRLVQLRILCKTAAASGGRGGGGHCSRSLDMLSVYLDKPGGQVFPARKMGWAGYQKRWIYKVFDVRPWEASRGTYILLQGVLGVSVLCCDG